MRSASPVLAEIQRLDPVRDHQRIIFLTTRIDFPFDTVRSLELALFRTFCVPDIAALLDQTGEFHARAQKRYDDTDLIVSELMDHGYDSERGKRALRRMNQLHGRFEIANEDFLYVLSTFVYEPIRWINRYGWRQLCEAERLGMFHFWREVGRRMNIRDIPSDYAVFEEYNREYERRQFRFNEASARVGAATRAMFLSWLPRLVRPLARPVIHALLDEAVLEAFGFPRPRPFLRKIVDGTLRVRAAFLRSWSRRRMPYLRTAHSTRTYPNGYVIEQLGPPPEATVRAP